MGNQKKKSDLCHNLNNLIYFTNTMEKTLSFDVAEIAENDLLTDFSLGTNYPTIKASDEDEDEEDEDFDDEEYDGEDEEDDEEFEEDEDEDDEDYDEDEDDEEDEEDDEDED